ncbi:DUF6221 family protein [Nocardia brasiliensis]|uniref:DUF6221 family protein n=1 Tax=Nocardia brasiliensis TaxID=37326 RepID=UPI0024541007|nr:DUF6221 family protein [Nocardia brasiliensis]
MSETRIDEFIRARLAEDEMTASDAPDPAQVLRQVRATRETFIAILEYTGTWELLVDSAPSSAAALAADIAEFRAIRAMAAVWSDHPDYQPEWRINDQ